MLFGCSADLFSRSVQQICSAHLCSVYPVLSFEAIASNHLSVFGEVLSKVLSVRQRNGFYIHADRIRSQTLGLL